MVQNKEIESLNDLPEGTYIVKLSKKLKTDMLEYLSGCPYIDTDKIIKDLFPSDSSLEDDLAWTKDGFDEVLKYLTSRPRKEVKALIDRILVPDGEVQVFQLKRNSGNEAADNETLSEDVSAK